MNNTEKTILNLIRKNSRLSNTEITKLTGKHKSTISPCIQSLLSSDYIKEAGIGSSTRKGGKPPVFLELNSEKSYCIGISIEPEKMKGIFTDFTGNILFTMESAYNDKSSTDAILNDIKEMISQIIERNKRFRMSVTGIGIGISGHVNSQEGIVYFSSGLKFTGIHLKDEIQRDFDYPVYVINDVNAALLAEKWFILDKQENPCKNFIYLYIGSTLQNMGLGLYLNGKLYEGSGFHAGEMYNFLSRNKLNDDMPEKEDFHIGKLKNYQVGTSENLDNIIKLYSAIIIEKMIYSIELLNPEVLVIGGDVIQAEKEFLDPLIKELKTQTDACFDEYLKIDVYKTELDENSTALGAVTCILREFFIPQ